MSEGINRRSIAIVHLKADNENEMQAKLFDLSLETSKAPDLVTIYRQGSKVIAWLKVETRHLSLSSETEKKVIKKKVNKKKIKAS